MNNVYIIELLCRDSGEEEYTDMVDKCFLNIEKARKCLNACLQDEYETLVEEPKLEDIDYYIVTNNDDNKEIWWENNITKEKDLLTKYTIKKLGVEK